MACHPWEEAVFARVPAGPWANALLASETTHSTMRILTGPMVIVLLLVKRGDRKFSVRLTPVYDAQARAMRVGFTYAFPYHPESAGQAVGSAARAARTESRTSFREARATFCPSAS